MLSREHGLLGFSFPPLIVSVDFFLLQYTLIEIISYLCNIACMTNWRSYEQIRMQKHAVVFFQEMGIYFAHFCKKISD